MIALLNYCSRCGCLALFFLLALLPISCAEVAQRTPPSPLMISLITSISNGHDIEVSGMLKEHPELTKEYEATHAGETLLHLASATCKNVEVLSLLLKLGIDPNASSNAQASPLSEAVFSGNISAVRFLIEHGAKINTSKANGNTPLYLAIMRVAESEEANVEIVDLLLKNGANPTTRNKSNECWVDLLKSVSDRKCLEALMDIFLRYKFDFSEKDVDGDTVFHVFVKEFVTTEWREHSINYLVKHNVSPLMKNSTGTTVYDLAKELHGKDFADKLTLDKANIP